MHPLKLIPPLEDIYKFASDYRMSDDALFHLAQLLLKTAPRTIFETGPGLSTYVILKYLEHMQLPSTNLVSLNHPGPWDSTIRKFLDGHGLDHTCIHCIDTDEKDWYHPPLPPLKTYDLVVLDGPDSSHARSCHRALDLYQCICQPRFTTVMIDDTHRPSERSIVQYLLDRGYTQQYVIKDTLYPNRTTTVLVSMQSQYSLSTLPKPEPPDYEA